MTPSIASVVVEEDVEASFVVEVNSVAFVVEEFVVSAIWVAEEYCWVFVPFVRLI